MTIPTLSTQPNSVTRPSTFNVDSDTFHSEFPPVIDAINQAVSDIQAGAAAAAAGAAAANAIKWVSGSFSDGNARWSPLNYQSYRKKGDGPGTTDPSLDPTNWASLGSAQLPGAVAMTLQLYGAF